jgi:hypothetical protein
LLLDKGLILSKAAAALETINSMVSRKKASGPLNPVIKAPERMPSMPRKTLRRPDMKSLLETSFPRNSKMEMR